MLDSAGAEVGDLNHCKAFPPRVVDEGYKLLCEQLKGYFTNSNFTFPLPFSLITEKYQILNNILSAMLGTYCERIY